MTTTRTRGGVVAAAVSGAVLASVAVTVAVLPACGDDRTPRPAPAASSAAVIDPGDDGRYEPTLRPEDVVDRIDNRWHPLLPGARWVYEGTSDGESERIEVEVLTERRRVMGIDAVVVRDRAFVDGELAEDTVDFYAQDAEGNVWYLGEETAEYEAGEIVSTAGSWEAGVDGARPGIVMLADPRTGQAYRQEFLAGEAEDMGEVIATGGTVTVAAGHFDDVVTTRDWTPLEPDIVEEKHYAPGIGFVVGEHVAGGEGRVELVEFTPGT